MTEFEWFTIGAGYLTVVVTSAGLMISVNRANERNRQSEIESADKRAQSMRAEYTALTQAAHALIEAVRSQFDLNQKAQDHNFGETAAALRQRCYEIELYARDHYATKDEVDNVLTELKEMRSEIKQDFRELSDKFDKRH